MEVNRELLEDIRNQYGDVFYILDVEQFAQNYDELLQAFKKYYPNTIISYSYKTNYIPQLCKIILKKGGYAEIVSDMEYSLALKVNVPKNKVVFNGPWKDDRVVEDILLNGGIVNLDSMYDFEMVKRIASKADKKIKVGIRVNFDIQDQVISRFGFDINDKNFKEILSYIKDEKNNLELRGIHSHFASRDIKYWPNRARNLINLIEKYNLDLEYISLGGGIFGKMDDSLKVQFDSPIPTYDQYANSVAPMLYEYYQNKEKFPQLFIEPGSALVGDCMKFVAPVVSIKNIRNITIATLLGSIYNINPTLNTKNPPIRVYHMSNEDNLCEYQDVKFGGFTCIESDYLYKGYNGKLGIGDFVVFGNVGSYSIVLKPPFILPNFPIVSIENNQIELIKRKETFDDLFQTYNF